ncbi:phospholipase A2, membrane associated-like isoform X2 [Passer domesticus]|uniref:phospholipase A2, membrane associated-like isoform X2 n=1 Tax=Passer domesticus TaxID=48849 RepID=UPI0030FE24B3
MINIFPNLSKSSAGAPASPGAAARRGAGRGRGVPRPGFGTHEPFWSSQLELAGWTRRAGSPREDRRTASGPGERKMKVLLVLTMLFACSVFTAHGKHPRTFTPGLEGSTVGNLTAHGCYRGWGTSRASVDRCCLLRACCYARLAARRCRVGPVQPLSVPRAGIAACSSGTRCQRGACRCERAARLCRARLGPARFGPARPGQAQLHRRAGCRGRAGRC